MPGLLDRLLGVLLADLEVVQELLADLEVVQVQLAEQVRVRARTM
ncbi:unnamed protein product [Heligmosomoides polygyrus]|uniref:PABC domain-containing protein n=1 Tax=Heligmosomoides polygyrus TaxID=6339 RepID=A0A183G021_HELPZ|nr:unnamed protein product [Heligmosomoides polygyrus]